MGKKKKIPGEGSSVSTGLRCPYTACLDVKTTPPLLSSYWLPMDHCPFCRFKMKPALGYPVQTQTDRSFLDLQRSLSPSVLLLMEHRFTRNKPGVGTLNLLLLEPFPSLGTFTRPCQVCGSGAARNSEARKNNLVQCEEEQKYQFF